MTAASDGFDIDQAFDAGVNSDKYSAVPSATPPLAVTTTFGITPSAVIRSTEPARFAAFKASLALTGNSPKRA